MTTPYINLDRKFHDLTTTELEDPEHLASFVEHKLAGIGWEELLNQSCRAVILAEAGAGKTREMIEQTKRLTGDGRAAFFIALESLDREELPALLSPEEEKKFEAWKLDGNQPAWFFLDSVDELKLTAGKLDRALLRLSKSIDTHLDRARIIISCRPNDWRPNLDLVTFQQRLPLPTRRAEPTSEPSHEVFLEALRRDRGDPFPRSEKEEVKPSSTVRTVILLPMNDRQIRLYAEQSGVHDAGAFLTEISRQNAWTFARRPLDLAELIATWVSSGRLGTRAEQHEANIVAKLKDDPDRRDTNVLTDARARVGAERLAIAMTLTRTRTFLSPDQTLDIQRAEGVLDPASILQDWTESERQTLLRRALFDPATYGRVRFHHRSVQEYLAAQRLRALREKGMSIKALFRLLFTDPYDYEVVFPSMRAIAAWLALWDDTVRQELMKREPEALLSLGDPESLAIGARGQLVAAFVNAYGQGSWRGLNIPIDEVRRLSHPELAPIVQKLWGDGPANSDIREFLIEMIWQGPIESCADLVRAAALNSEWDDYHRIAAMRALVACGKTKIIRELVEDILEHPDSWPEKVVHGIAADIFPAATSVDELITLIKRTREPKRGVGGFEWALREIADNVDYGSKLAVDLRDKVAQLIWNGRTTEQQFYRIKGRRDYLTAGLAILCEKQLCMSPQGTDPGLIRACVIASRFRGEEFSSGEPIEKLRAHFQNNVTLRSIGFWAELCFMDEITPAKDDWNRFYYAEQHSLTGNLTEIDRPWLESALADEGRPERRGVALHALIQSWHWRGRVETERHELRTLLKASSTLGKLLDERTTPTPEHEKIEQSKLRSEKRELEETTQEALRLTSWQTWRDELIADPVDAFSPSKKLTTLNHIYSWLNSFERRRTRHNLWNKSALVQAFGSGIADRTEAELKIYWRSIRPQLWYERAPEERNSTPGHWIYGLCGISAEAGIPGWATSLLPDEACLAARYALLELNGFAPFISDLVAAHPNEVDAVIGEALSNEFNEGGNSMHLPTLQNLTYADQSLKRLLLPRLRAALSEWPNSFSDETEAKRTHNLGQVLSILCEVAGEADRHSTADECTKRYEANPIGFQAIVWLKSLFRLDASRGTQLLATHLSPVDDPDVGARGISIFSALFGERDASLLTIHNPSQRACTLGQLVRLAYKCIRREDDQVHEGTYSPNTRDDAETARNFLLAALLDMPGPDARSVVLELAKEPSFAHFSDRLRLFARQRAAADAEFAPYEAAAIAALEKHYEAPPRDRDGLFRTMIDRLEDLSHDMLHHDLTDRRTLQSITEETEMQRTLALRLQSKANGTYVVTREDEVADLKRTDIRLSAVQGHQKAVIEIKIADKRWSLSDLERALRNQLVGQYLRHTTCRAGCLLLTYDGRKKNWINPVTRKGMNFQELLVYLNRLAEEIERSELFAIRLAVRGLDLTDPLLASASLRSRSR